MRMVVLVVEDFRSAGLLWEKWTWWDLKAHTSSDVRSSSMGGDTMIALMSLL